MKRSTKLDGLERVEVTSRAQWRAWLRKNHKRTEGIWLVTYKKHVADKYLSFEDKVQEALCFGWIDSVPRKLDADRTMHYLSPRRPGSVWSAINKAHVERLIAQRRMTAAGLAKVEAAKADGSWHTLTSVDRMEIPADLAKALARSKTAQEHFNAFPPGIRKNILYWVTSAKTAETRKKRISTTVHEAAQGRRAFPPPRP
ncbi:MAG: YdeI/OmpD-associated family protein [Flavobacteriales bacterium]|nr:YdeI/OmpD-associated family protein [Flavobacteriales bacterium]